MEVGTCGKAGSARFAQQPALFNQAAFGNGYGIQMIVKRINAGEVFDNDRISRNDTGPGQDHFSRSAGVDRRPPGDSVVYAGVYGCVRGAVCVPVDPAVPEEAGPPC